eukprot:gene3238-4052_t
MNYRNLSYFEGPIVENEDLTFSQILSDTVKRYPNKTAFIIENNSNNVMKKDEVMKTSYTYSELENNVNYLTCGLIDLGIRKGDYIAIWCPTRIELIMFYFALAKIGAISVHLFPHYSSDEINDTLKSINCKGIIVSELNDTQIHNSSIPELISQFINLQFIISLDEIKDNNYNTMDKVITNFQRIISKGKEIWEIENSYLIGYESLVSSTEPSQVLLTSGSTGKNKLIVHNQRSFVNNVKEINKRTEFTENDILGNFGKLHHVSGHFILLMVILEGATAVIHQQNIQSSYTLMVLKSIPRFINLPEFHNYNTSTLKKGHIGSYPFNHKLGESVRKIFGCGLLQMYGMTENLVSFSTFPQFSKSLFIETVGKVFPNCLAKIVDSKGEIVEIGVVGQLLIKSNWTMLEYYGNPIKTSETIDKDGWLHTGDEAKFDSDGNCTIIGRMDDIIACSQENISPKEIEDFLSGHPKIKDIQVFGIPDDKEIFQIIATWIILKPNYQSLTIDELKLFFQGKKSLLKVPQHIELVSEFPLNINLKPMKRLMKQITIQNRLNSVKK